MLRKWTVGLELTKEASASIPIWVHIYNIPLEYWNFEILSYIASAISKPIHMNKIGRAHV